LLKPKLAPHGSSPTMALRDKRAGQVDRVRRRHVTRTLPTVAPLAQIELWGERHVRESVACPV
jgi:hypothetical protein